MNQGTRSWREPVSPLVAWRRKLAVLATVSRRQAAEPRTAAELAARIRDLQTRAADTTEPRRIVECWWRMESAAFAFFESHGPEADLASPEFPPEAGPPVHTGLGMAAVLSRGFDRAAIRGVIEGCGDPRFTSFAHETVGLMLAAYERDLTGGLFAVLGRLGLVRRLPLIRPELASFLGRMPLEHSDLAAHGYGRMLYFKSHRLGTAFTAAERSAQLPFEPCARGIVIAAALINCADLGLLLRLADDLGDSDEDRALVGGLLDTLLLFAWAAPRVLESLGDGSPTVTDLIAVAGRLTDEARAAGLGPPLLADPWTA